MQVAGKPFGEATILRVAEAYEKNVYRIEPLPENL